MRMSHHMTGERGFFVEVKSTSKKPVTFNGAIYGDEWVAYTPDNSCLPPSRIHQEAAQAGYLTYEGANAIAWMVMHYSNSFIDGVTAFGLTARVVEVEIEYHFEAKRKHEYDPLPLHAPQLPKG